MKVIIIYRIYHIMKGIYSNIKLSVYYLRQQRKQIPTVFDSIFITNDRDGGTRLFENSNITGVENKLILRRVGYCAWKDNFFRLEWENNRLIIKKKTLKLLFEKIKVKNIIIVSLVDFESIDDIMKFIIYYKIRFPSTRICVNVHDYYLICTNYNLICNDKYCRLRCYHNNCALYFKDKPIQLTLWRKKWNGMLSFCDEINCYSQSSKLIISEIYPDIADDLYTVTPHSMSYFKGKKIDLTAYNKVVIGFIGNICNQAKGLRVAQIIVNEFSEKVQIVFIGTSNKHIKHRKGSFNVKFIDKYKNEDLYGIVKENKISLVIFPSRTPETFSYVVSEIMMMNLPIFSFDIGAQGEKVSGYCYGKVFADTNNMLDGINSYLLKYGSN